jgi:glycerol-3-phosphate cytidylyltransferase-like family protein
LEQDSELVQTVWRSPPLLETMQRFLSNHTCSPVRREVLIWNNLWIQTHVAKHYKPDSFVNDAFEFSASKLKAEFNAEVEYTKAVSLLYSHKNTLRMLMFYFHQVGKLIASGQSKVSSKGDTYSWIITPKVEGGPLTDTAYYKATAKPGAKGCKAYLTGIQKTFVTEMVKLATQPHGLVHLDASDRKCSHPSWECAPALNYPVIFFVGNTFWLADGKTFSGFIDYGSMGTVGSNAYKTARCHISISNLSF